MNEQQLRLHIRKILRESRILKEQDDGGGDVGAGWGFFGSGDGTTGNLASTFITPFTDVFKVAKIAFKDVLSGVIFVSRALFTLNTGKMKQLKADYKKSREGYKKEYAAAMKDIDAALESSDAKLVKFMLNPGGYVAMSLGAQGINTTVDAASFLKDKFGFDEDTKAPDQRTPPGPIRGLMSDLKVLFFGENAWLAGDLIIEQEEKKEEKQQEPEQKASEKEMTAQVKETLNEIGFTAATEKAVAGMIEEKQKQLEALREEIKGKTDFVNAFIDATTLEDLKKVASLPAAGETNINEYVSEIEKAVEKKLLEMNEMEDEQRESFFEELQATDEGRNLSPESPPEELEKAIGIMVFGQLKSDAQSEMEEGRKELIPPIMDVAADGMSPEQIDELAGLSDEGKRYSDIIKNFHKEITTF